MRVALGLMALVLVVSGAYYGKRQGQAVARDAAIVGVCAEHSPLRIIDRPVPFSMKRQALTLDYIRAHYDPQAANIKIAPQMVVIHWTGRPSIASTFAMFTPESLPFWRRDIRKGGKVNVSAHYLIDRDGTIYRLMPETWMARHVIGLNRIAIGIENAGGPRHPLTDAQLRANAELVRYLVNKYPAIRYLIGHHEYGRFRDTPLWQERDPLISRASKTPVRSLWRGCVMC